MQLEWTTNFMQRVLLNASKAYVRQLDKNEHYEVLQPVYALRKKMRALWLRYLREIDENTHTAPPELLENAELRKALGIVEESAYTEGEMYAYDEYWDAVRTEKTLFFGKWEESKAEGLAEGLAQGLAEGIKKGRAEGIAEGEEKGKKLERLEIARKALQKGLSVEDAAALTELPEKIKML